MGLSREFGVICMYNRTLKKTKSGERGGGEGGAGRDAQKGPDVPLLLYSHKGW